MEPSLTAWTLIEGAAQGRSQAREDFTRRYLPVVRSTLSARWRGKPLTSDIDDATQEVFVDCFKRGGALERADRETGSGFRGFLFGIVRNVALRAEERAARERDRRHRGTGELDELAGRAEPMSRAFDRSWAEALVKEAGDLHSERAREQGGAYARRRELLRLRFEEDLPLRKIAGLWSLEHDYVHHQYAQGRKEYQQCLREVVGFHQDMASEERLDEECRRLLELLR